jgi:hypothetical protein
MLRGGKSPLGTTGRIIACFVSSYQSLAWLGPFGENAHKHLALAGVLCGTANGAIDDGRENAGDVTEQYYRSYAETLGRETM